MSDKKANSGKILIGKPGPFQIVESEYQGSIDNPLNAPRRRYDCSNYETCLIIAAGLNWDSFTCRGCNGLYEELLFWRARQEINKDKTVKKICDLPKACLSNEISRHDIIPETLSLDTYKAIPEEAFKLKVVGKD